MANEPTLSNVAGNTDPTTTAKLFKEIVPSDTIEFSADLKGLYIQTDGVVRCEDWLARVTDFQVSAGQVLPIRPRKVMSTGTTSVVVGLWN